MREILDFCERYDLTRLVDVISQIGHALAYAHEHRVAHGDIKPENILVGPFGEVLLLDGGLAKVWNPDGTSDVATEVASRGIEGDLSLTGRGELQGTVSYVSPEQINRAPTIDARTDLYSLGAVLYEVLAGRTAAQVERVDHIVESRLELEPVPPSQVSNFDGPRLLEELTMRYLKKDPAERVQTARELIRYLQVDWRSD